MIEYKFINKSIFFPENGILTFGDLHLGYESMMRQQGLILPFNQLENSKKEVQEIIEKIGKEKIKKIIILGDLKHYFNFDKSEKFEVREFLEFLESEIPNAEIILIKGNHEKMELDNRKYLEFYVEGNLAFSHGDKLYPVLFDKKIKTIVIAHLHPAINLTEGVKKEKYKCYLVGRFKKKEVIILPSFLSLATGTEVKEEYKYKKEWAMIPKTDLRNFKVFVVGEDKNILEFGRLKDFN